WSATPASVPYADLGNPQTLNLYGYARNLPTSRSDADGRSPTGFLARIWHGIWHGGCTLTGGCPTDEEAAEEAENKTEENGAGAKLQLIRHGFNPKQISSLTNQQAIDAYEALLDGKEVFS